MDRTAHRRLVVLLLVLQGCTTAGVEPDYPDSWPLPHALVARTCLPPTGLFSDQGSSSSPADHNPPLAAILFEDKLRGFPVEAIRISQGANATELVIRGVLGGVDLRKDTRLSASEGNCSGRWRGELATGAVNSQLVSESILYTGGVIIPLSETNVFSLQLAEDGSLLVHLKVKATVLGALMVPVFFEDEYWLHYPIYRGTPNPTTPTPPDGQMVE